MKNERLYLRPNIQAEPLVDQWYAWSNLIPPATAARNLTERHLKIMDSYIKAPQIHANAVKNPKLLGGPFIDYNGERVDEIRSLVERTKRVVGRNRRPRRNPAHTGERLFATTPLSNDTRDSQGIRRVSLRSQQQSLFSIDRAFALQESLL
jgi:hypothetical protein